MKLRKTLEGAARCRPRQGGHLPEPLLETTFTLLDSVMHSRNNRGLGGLIFPPSSQSRGENTGKGGEEREKSRGQARGLLLGQIHTHDPNMN